MQKTEAKQRTKGRGKHGKFEEDEPTLLLAKCKKEESGGTYLNEQRVTPSQMPKVQNEKLYLMGIEELMNYSQAMKDRNWRIAMEKEM